jgi:UDP:flavonoid glycosyltransferase YjiC (YdhE family)
MAATATKRVLIVSGSIGLGHAARDLAIARALRAHRPGIEIDWLAADPARRLLTSAGETVLPESSHLPDETAAAERAAKGFSMNIAAYTVRVGRSWRRSIGAFERVLARRTYDVIVGDETYEIALALHRRPTLTRAPFVMIYDFVGMDARTRNPLEHLVVYGFNRVWSGGPHGHPPSADRVLFVGEPGDVPDRRFGPRLPNRRAYAQRYYDFLGYVLSFDPGECTDRERVRTRLGYDGHPLVVATIGGTSVGAELLQLCADAYPGLRARIPDLTMVLVCGPRVPPSAIRAPAGVQVRSYVPKLYEHLAASDLAIVQGGGTTTLELTALRRPFLYFPLEGHFEQEGPVADRVARHRAGVRMRFSQTTPAGLVEAATAALGSTPDWPAIPVAGAARAAEIIATVMGRPDRAGLRSVRAAG